MILMLIRTALWGLAIIAAAFAFVWLKDSDGGVTLTLAGRAYGPFRLIETVAIVLAVAFLLWFTVKAFSFLVALVRFFSGDETALSRFWTRSRERRGFDALAGGLIAMAEGNGRAALTKARKAERLLDRPALTRLLVAQSAEAAGETAVAKEYYKRLAGEPGTAYVGVKGLLEQALRAGDKAKALKLATHAFELKAREPELLTTLFDLQCAAGEWEGARRTLDAATKAGALTKDVAQRRAAVLQVADAREAENRGEAAKARELIARARRQAPGLVPAAVMLAAQQNADGAPRKAAKTLREAWRAEPHPDIAAAFAALAPDESPAARRKRFQDLLKIHPDAAETRLLSAEMALADDDAPAARAAMGDLAETHPTARTLALMAAIERADGGDESLVRGWLARAVAAPRMAQWTCANCGAHHNEWAPICRRCEAFDTLAWTEGEAGTSKAEADSALLPIIAEVGAAGTASPTPDDGEPAPSDPDNKPERDEGDPAPAEATDEPAAAPDDAKRS
ncbi:heme biosynthesis protein HemY [Pikeienuella sp. HZG-20]|uniref:heme biosynthesis protein HemY n=1 Tax=Paludibacillus litoralis TaxID=3133267 RepID=UPI0030EF632F